MIRSRKQPALSAWRARLMLSAAFALGMAGTAAAQTTVTFRSWSPIVETTTQMISSTQMKFPDVKIEATIFNYPDYIVDLQTRAASGDLPDIIGLEPGALTQQYRQFLTPLQGCAEKTWGANWKDKFFPIAVDQSRLGNPAGDNNFYGLPVLTQTIQLWYTIPVMKDAGLSPPKTYDELVKAAQVLQPKGEAALLVGAADGWLRRDIYMQLIHNIAPGLIYKAEVGEAKFTDPPFVEAMTYWKKLFDDGVIQPGALGLSAYPGSMELIEGGRAAMFPMGAWWQQQATRPNPPPLSANGLSGFAPMKFPDVTGKGAPDDLLGGIDVMIGITKNSKNPDAACKVLTDWIAGAGAQTLINTFNDLPAVKGLNPQSYASDNQKQVWRTFTEDWLPKVKYARQLRSPAVKQALEDALAAVAAGEKSPQDAMASVQAAVEKK
ncbi:MAG: extracellular solute-binding protein [Methylobacteriaceae bacterium]|nr:extracellular solute-binding protein [Methylobacteriaceae bacterium]